MLYICGSLIGVSALIVVVCSVAWMVWEFIHAVEGVEDEDGFHRGNEV